MSEAKTYVFGNEGTNGNMLGLLAPFLQQRGLDPNMVMAMMNNRGNDGFGQGGWFIWVIFLFFLMGWGRNGWGNNFGGNEGGYPLANMLNNDTGREMLMSAIQGNGTAISQLATTLNCDVNAIQGAINQVQGAICNVGNQIGLTSQQVINAIQQGNMSIAQQLSTCCCDVKDAITRGNYENQIATLNQTNQLQNSINFVNSSVERGFAQTGYETQAQTCALQNTINQGVQKIMDGQAAAELRELHGIISKQNDDLSTYKTAGIISQQIAPITGALASLRADVDGIKCKLPDTKTITDPVRYVPLNTEINVPFHLGYGCGYGYGFNGFTNGFNSAF